LGDGDGLPTGRLRRLGPAGGRGPQEDLAEVTAQGRVARFESLQHPDPPLPQRLGQIPGLGGLARPIGAFKGDKPPPLPPAHAPPSNPDGPHPPRAPVVRLRPERRGRPFPPASPARLSEGGRLPPVIPARDRKSVV